MFSPFVDARGTRGRGRGRKPPTLRGRNFILFVPRSLSFRVLQKGNEKNSRFRLHGSIHGLKTSTHRWTVFEIKKWYNFGRCDLKNLELSIKKNKFRSGHWNIEGWNLKFRSIELLDEELLNRQLKRLERNLKEWCFDSREWISAGRCA